MVPDAWTLRRELNDYLDQNNRVIGYLIDAGRAEVARLVRSLESGLPNDETWRRRVDDLARIAATAMQGRLALAKSRVESINLQLGALDPVATLNRGFSVVQKNGPGQVVTMTDQVAPREELNITVSDGAFLATVGGEKPAKSSVKKRRTASQDSGMKRLL